MEKWQNPETIVLWIIIILTLIIVLLGTIVILVRLSYKRLIKQKQEENQLLITHQQMLLETTIEVQEKERNRIASDLHDELIGKLSTIQLQHQIAPERLQLDALIDESIKVARRITHDLVPPLIEETSLSDLIYEILTPWNDVFSVDFEIDIRNNQPIETTLKVQITRIVQEIITNISKHSKATTIRIHYRKTNRCLALSIVDDGVGIELSNETSGLGLKSIESRAQYIGANYKLKSGKNAFTSFLFLIQLK